MNVGLTGEALQSMQMDQGPVNITFGLLVMLTVATSCWKGESGRLNHADGMLINAFGETAPGVHVRPRSKRTALTVPNARVSRASPLSVSLKEGTLFQDVAGENDVTFPVTCVGEAVSCDVKHEDSENNMTHQQRVHRPIE